MRACSRALDADLNQFIGQMLGAIGIEGKNAWQLLYNVINLDDAFKVGRLLLNLEKACRTHVSQTERLRWAYDDLCMHQ